MLGHVTAATGQITTTDSAASVAVAVAVEYVGEFPSRDHPLQEGAGMTLEGYASRKTSAIVIVHRGHVVEVQEGMAAVGLVVARFSTVDGPGDIVC